MDGHPGGRSARVRDAVRQATLAEHGYSVGLVRRGFADPVAGPISAAFVLAAVQSTGPAQTLHPFFAARHEQAAEVVRRAVARASSLAGSWPSPAASVLGRWPKAPGTASSGSTKRASDVDSYPEADITVSASGRHG
ncbi:hypothetical protein [Nonomuraea sp. NPDC048826]|uniref:hypothetical protein n=1 Tax=Nonomuraea sp. NPDC048826 TaxID=3364347 RepID=UPI00371E31D8